MLHFVIIFFKNKLLEGVRSTKQSVPSLNKKGLNFFSKLAAMW